MEKVMLRYTEFWRELKRRSWTAKDFAREAGLTYGSALQITNGNRNIGTRRTAKILKAFRGEVQFYDIFKII